MLQNPELKANKQIGFAATSGTSVVGIADFPKILLAAPSASQSTDLGSLGCPNSLTRKALGAILVLDRDKQVRIDTKGGEDHVVMLC